MVTEEFYKKIDADLEVLIEKYKNDAYLKKQRKDANNRKSYAFLIWFLEFYGQVSNYVNYITDGNDDKSCDIVFDKKDNQGNTVFYVVQSKWNNEANALKKADKDEILKALSDFETILRGNKETPNEKLQKKLSEFQTHLENNGEVKFIFLTLAPYENNADENIETFINNNNKIKFEVIDIDRIREDYIDRNYKEISPINPLKRYENPKESSIKLEIEKLESADGNFIKIERPFEAYVFVIRPKTIFDLFDKFGFSLFFKNVRNPLLESHFNKEIEKTAKDNPAWFWYYNNGITAIASLLPKIGNHAKFIDLTGLQVINGAQTVYAIYNAYKNSSPVGRQQMNSEALITLRLLKSGGKEFDLNVTRFTNSQNPVGERDFCANDDIQIQLQNESYKTKFWYVKRRDEFRNLPKNIKKVSNTIFANAYLAYQLQDPISAFLNSKYKGKNLIFTSSKNHSDGLYEKIFNSKTTFKDMLASFHVFDILFKLKPFEYSQLSSTPSDIYHKIALFKVVFSRYLNKKYNSDNVNPNNEIIKIIEKQDDAKKENIIKTFMFIDTFFAKKSEHHGYSFDTFIDNYSFHTNWITFEKIKNELEELDFEVEEIEKITIKSKYLN